MSITSSDGLVTSNMHLYQYIPIYIVIRFGVRSNLGCLIEVFLVEQEQLSHVPIPRTKFLAALFFADQIFPSFLFICLCLTSRTGQPKPPNSIEF
ncbi:hypothetical protein GW17_00041042 [Ensete ventricosum]|nr:hypothetical protein GW17_00041042 [Ensete ventricosum]